MGVSNSSAKPFQLDRLFRRGQSATLQMAVSDGEDDMPEGPYSCRVEQVLADAVLVRFPPTYLRPPSIPESTRVVARFLRLGVRFCIDATVLRALGLDLLHLGRLEDLRRDDQRTYVRVETLLRPTTFQVRENAEMTAKVMVPKIVDVSLGGCRLTCVNPISVGNRVRMSVELSRIIGIVEFEAEVRRVQATTDTHGIQYRMGLEFVEISQRDLDHIAGFVLYQQQTLKRKGLL